MLVKYANFVKIQPIAPDHEEEGIKGDGDREDATILFSCPNEGCVKMYKRHSSLGKHLFFGKCRIKAEKENSLKKAKRTYHALL